jgi:hypothetical protein
MNTTIITPMIAKISIWWRLMGGAALAVQSSTQLLPRLVRRANRRWQEA